MADQIYILTHAFDLPDLGEEVVKLIGVYSTEDDARAAEERARARPGFSEQPDGFNIEAYELDRDHWLEGFDPNTLLEDEEESI
jgi:homoserine kinase type II